MSTSAARRTTLVVGGDTISIDATLNVQEWVFSGSGTLLASTTISPAAIATTGITYRVKIRYNATFELDGNTITIFSHSLSAEQARGGNTIFDCQYIGGAWIVCVIDSYAIGERGNEGALVTTLDGSGGTVTLDPATDYQTQELIGSGSLAANYVYQTGGTPQNGDSFKVIYNGTFSPTGSNITIFGYTLTDEEVLNGGVTVVTEYNGATWTTDAYRNPFLATIYETIVVPISFESGEQGDNIILVYYPFEIIYAAAYVTKALSGTDDATITLAIGATLVTNGVITVPLSSAINTSADCTPTADNTSLVAYSEISLIGAKTTVGGKVNVSLILKRI